MPDSSLWWAMRSSSVAGCSGEAPEEVQLMITSQSLWLRMSLMVSRNFSLSMAPRPSSARMCRCTTAAPSFQAS